MGIRELTATAYLLDLEKSSTLLIFHNKLGKWLPPGGHIHPGETPVEAAIREVREEVGLEVDILKQENIWIDRWNAKSFERPFLCLIEEIPAYGDQPAHQHLDFIYLALPKSGELKHNPLEVGDAKWFDSRELSRMQPDVDIFEETLQTIEAIFKTPLNPSQRETSKSLCAF